MDSRNQAEIVEYQFIVWNLRHSFCKFDLKIGIHFLFSATTAKILASISERDLVRIFVRHKQRVLFSQYVCWLLERRRSCERFYRNKTAGATGKHDQLKQTVPSYLSQPSFLTCGLQSQDMHIRTWSWATCYITRLSGGWFSPGGGRGYSHTLPVWVCAAQQGRDFEAPDLERGIHFRGVF